MKTLLQLSALGINIWQKVKIFVAYLYLYLSSKFVILPNLNFGIKIFVLGFKCNFLVNHISDFWTIKDVLIDLAYDYDLGDSLENIVDLGGNIGVSAVFFAVKYPLANIFVVEPNPFIFNKIVYNIKNFPNIKIKEFAIGSISENKEMFISNNSPSSSFFVKNKTSRPVLVRTVSPKDLLKELSLLSVSLIKFDIEGSEKSLFDDCMIPAKYYLGEMHYDLLPENYNLRGKVDDYVIREDFISKNRSIIFMIKNA